MSDSNFQHETPTHPGKFVKIEIIDPLGLSVKQAAEALGITRQALSTFLNGQSDLSPEMAIRLDKAFGVSLDTLMRMQNAFDIAKAKERAREIHVTRYIPGQKQEPQFREGKQK
ncbi:HigA family addiction module antitoxin [Stappia indica]|uniref:HigA family addiction module antitoxin n=1 Tax=Stappia indica TaxID=538381 RepID=UPI001D196886|nr:HigA family addiction module antitoxin [Stappia indica]MCC4242974.1 HigA family addiction module antitoxin [Stappia indica]